MSLKQGNFSFRARTAQNWLRMGKYGTYLEFNTSQEAPKHCPTFDSPTQCFASAHFRSPPVRLQFASSSPPVRLRFRCASNFVCPHIPSLISFQQWNRISETHFSTSIILWTNRVVSFTTVLVIFTGTLCLHGLYGIGWEKGYSWVNENWAFSRRESCNSRLI